MSGRRAQLLPFASVVLFVVLALALSSFTGDAGAFSTGQVRYSGSPQVGGATCATCHTDGDASTTVSLDVAGPVQVGQSVAVTVTVQGGPGAAVGFNASTNGLIGLLNATDSATQITSDEATHTTPQAQTNGVATFTFAWTAPAEPGTVDWYVAAVSGNDNGRNSGDDVATTMRSIQVVAAPTPTPTPTPTSGGSLIGALAGTPTPTATPSSGSGAGSGDGAASAGASGDTSKASGVHGFGLNPQPAAEPPAATPAIAAPAGTGAGDALAATGGSATASASIAVGLFAAGALLIVAARRSD